MSLFDASQENTLRPSSAQGLKFSLFTDEPSTGINPASPSLFADEGPEASALWNSKRTRHEIVKKLLVGANIPEYYTEAYDRVPKVYDGATPRVGLTIVRNILSSSKLDPADQDIILSMVAGGDEESGTNGLDRNEFNVLLALVGLAQEGDDLTLDAVDDRRQSLPAPNIFYLDQILATPEPHSPAQLQQRSSSPLQSTSPIQEPRSTDSHRPRQSSFTGLDSDPWASPELHRDHDHGQAEAEAESPELNGHGGTRSGANTWANKTTFEDSHGDATSKTQSNGRANAMIASSSESGWGGPTNLTGRGGTSQPQLTGFGFSGEESGSRTSRRPLGASESTNPLIEEVVTVTLLPEKEGIFMFQHRNYEVKSARRGSAVTRRYSDFVWLLDCLQKRYPFRQLPLLPPKRIAVNGTHLVADSHSFLEKRRRGLVRFTNALVRHPILSQEQLTVMFLTVPTELAVWRKQATISVQDEFTGRDLPPDLEDSLSPDVTNAFDTVRSGVKRSAEIYINLCTLLERLAKRNQGLAADQLRFSLALQSLIEATKDTYAVDTDDVSMVNEGIKATARHLATSKSLLEDEARAWDEGMLEDLKRQRDCLVSMRDMFDRRDRYARNNIPQLERRIENNEQKLHNLRSRPQGTIKPGEIEKVEEAIFKDKESIVQQHARGVFITEAIRDELAYFQQSQYHISRLYQDWSQERVKYSELQADNWRSLSDEVEGMPIGG